MSQANRRNAKQFIDTICQHYFRLHHLNEWRIACNLVSDIRQAVDARRQVSACAPP